MDFLETIEKICSHMPPGYILNICIEDGAAWVDLYSPDGRKERLPDAADKNMVEQVNDALCKANYFDPEAKADALFVCYKTAY
jgi:hypothetical protein